VSRLRLDHCWRPECVGGRLGSSSLASAGVLAEDISLTRDTAVRAVPRRLNLFFGMGPPKVVHYGVAYREGGPCKGGEVAEMTGCGTCGMRYVEFPILLLDRPYFGAFLHYGVILDPPTIGVAGGTGSGQTFVTADVARGDVDLPACGANEEHLGRKMVLAADMVSEVEVRPAVGGLRNIIAQLATEGSLAWHKHE